MDEAARVGAVDEGRHVMGIPQGSGPDMVREQIAGPEPVVIDMTHRGRTRWRPDLDPRGGEVVTARKRARVLAIRMDRAFLVRTEHGDMRGEPGDWLVTNHPDDDPSSDTWPVSAARFAATYEVVP